MTFCMIQPPYNGNRPFEKNYFKMAKMGISSLLMTGFPNNKITIITYEQEHADYFGKKYNINTKVHNTIPNKFQKLFDKREKSYCFFKPIAFYNALKNPINENTIMAFCDVDILFMKNPTKYLTTRETDVWSSEGMALPLRRDIKKGKTIKNPKITYDSLKEFYWKCGDGGLSHLHMLYKWPLDNMVHSTGLVIIKPNCYNKLIERWYEMCDIVIDRKDRTKGDQEIFSAAVWSLGVSHSRCSGGIKTHYVKNNLCKQYFCNLKKEMPNDYNKLRKKWGKSRKNN